MRFTSVFSCIMTMISNFMILFIFQIFIFKFFLEISEICAFSYDFCCSFVNNFILFFLKLIILIPCSVKHSQNFFIQSLTVYMSCLFSTLLNEDIAGIEKPDGICSFTFAVDEFSGLFLHASVFSIIHSRSFKIHKNFNFCYFLQILFYFFMI